MSAITFVVPVRNDHVRLAALLQSIRRAGAVADVPTEIIVVDNLSRDGSAEVAEQAGAVVLTMGSRFVSELRNAGARAASSPLLAFVDADHSLDEHWTAAAIDVFQNPKVAGAGALCIAPPDGTWVQRTYDRLRRRPKGQHIVRWLGSGNLLVRRDAFEAVGGFDESLQTCEDVDLCRRLTRHGGLLVSDERFRNIHWGDPQTLKVLFLGELWRGRDNLRVALREGWRDVFSPSVAMPIMTLVGSVVFVGSIVLGRLQLGLAAASLIIAVVAARAIAMAATAPFSSPSDLVRIVAVAGTYEIARGLALVARVGHATRSKAARAA